MKYNFKDMKVTINVGEFTESDNNSERKNNVALKDASASFEVGELQLELEANELPELFETVKNIVVAKMKSDDYKADRHIEQRELDIKYEKERRETLFAEHKLSSK